MQKVIWWEGPPWLQQDSEFWPRRPDINLTRELPEFNSKVLILQPLDDSLWRRYTSFDRLLRTVAWCRRFYSNCHHQDKENSCWLTAEELDGARARLLYLSQLQDFRLSAEEKGVACQMLPTLPETTSYLEKMVCFEWEADSRMLDSTTTPLILASHRLCIYLLYIFTSRPSMPDLQSC